MNDILLYLELSRKAKREKLSELEEAFLRSKKCIMMIGEILIEEDKLHITEDEAIEMIKECFSRYL